MRVLKGDMWGLGQLDVHESPAQLAEEYRYSNAMREPQALAGGRLDKSKKKYYVYPKQA